jgi:hypothetical protein
MDITLTAFAADCIVRGVLVLGADRLADHLNATEGLQIRDAVLESLDDGHTVALPSLEVPIADLCVVLAAGPRGVAGRRVRNRTDLVNVRVGPYTVVGDLHSSPGSNPLLIHRRRGAFLAVTEARLLSPAAAATAADWPATLLVNLSLIGQVLGAGGAVAGLESLPETRALTGDRAREILG